MNIKDLWRNKWNVLTHANTWMNKSPLTVVAAVVFVIQPILSSAIGLVGDYTWVRQRIDPSQRPVTAAEFKLLNDQVDAIQASLIEINSKLVVKSVIVPEQHKSTYKSTKPVVLVEADSIAARLPPPIMDTAIAKFDAAKIEREKLSKKLDVAYIEQKQKPKF